MRRFVEVTLLLLGAIAVPVATRCGDGIDIYWRDFNGTVPCDALSTGHDVYIAQIAIQSGGNIPGSYFPNKQIAVTEANGRKIALQSNFKILCTTDETDRFYWELINVSSLNGPKLRKCVVGGYEVGSKLYVGKFFHENEWKVAKVFPPDSEYKGLRGWTNQGGHIFTDDFYILMFE